VSDPVIEWLGPRLDGVPDTLVQQLKSVLVNSPSGQSPAETLRVAADGLIGRAVDHSSDGDATELLAADALITYVCEAVSEIDPGRLMDLS
jgi:hypothetical protein